MGNVMLGIHSFCAALSLSYILVGTLRIIPLLCYRNEVPQQTTPVVVVQQPGYNPSGGFINPAHQPVSQYQQQPASQYQPPTQYQQQYGFQQHPQNPPPYPQQPAYPYPVQ